MKKVSLSYVCEKVKPSGLADLLSEFNVEKFFIEIINMKAENTLCNKLKSDSIEYRTSRSSNQTYIDILISYVPDRMFTSTLEEIIGSDPETLIFYVTKMPFYQFLHSIKKTANDRIVAQGICDCIFEIMFDEKALLITYNAELYGRHDLILRIEEIVCKQFSIGC